MGVFDVVYYEFNESLKFKMADRGFWFFGVADYEFASILLKFKITNPMWRKKNKNYSMLIKIGM